MTVPTQEQIKAAQKIIADRLGYEESSAKAWLIAEAALTAAAETTPLAINRRLSDASLKALSLGTQAIMERMADLEADELRPTPDCFAADIEAATIERCLQKIELFIVNNRISGEVQALINAIRMLKDQP